MKSSSISYQPIKVYTQAFKDYSNTQSSVKKLQSKIQSLRESQGQNDFNDYKPFQEYEKRQIQNQENVKSIFKDACLPKYQRGKGLQDLANKFQGSEKVSQQPDERQFQSKELYRWPDQNYLAFERRYRSVPKKRVFKNLITNREVDYSRLSENLEQVQLSLPQTETDTSKILKHQKSGDSRLSYSRNLSLGNLQYPQQTEIQTTRDKYNKASPLKESAEVILQKQPQKELNIQWQENLNSYQQLFNNKRFPKTMIKTQVNNVITGQFKDYSQQKEVLPSINNGNQSWGQPQKDVEYIPSVQQNNQYVSKVKSPIFQAAQNY